MEDDTVTIPAAPKPATMIWLGIAVALAVLSWLVTLATTAGINPEADLLVICGLAISCTASIAAVVAWTRYCLARQAAHHHRELMHLMNGHYGLAMAEVRRLRQLIDENGGRAAVERTELGVKITKVIQMIPDYFEGVADTYERMAGADNNVRAIVRMPRN